jgi:uncharacterized protein (TIGR00296 family)
MNLNIKGGYNEKNKLDLLQIPRKILEWEEMKYGNKLSEEEIKLLLENFFKIYKLDDSLKDYGIFITIDKIGELRGCIGTFNLQKNISEAIARYTLYSAFRDDRFEPIKEEELKDLTYKVNFLKRPEKINTLNVKELSERMIFGKSNGHGITMYFNNGLNSTYLSSVLPDHFNIVNKTTLIKNWDILVNSLKKKSSKSLSNNIKLERIEIYLCTEFKEEEKLNLIGGNNKYYYKINYKNRN